MLRRAFMRLAGLSSILAGAGVAGLRGREHSRFYSVRRGHQGTVYCDGVEVPYAISCKTGRKGWVRYLVADRSGEIMIVGNDTVHDYRHGVVEYRSLRKST